MTQEFADRVVLVTGGTRGIGRAIVEAFLAQGARVAVVARSAVDCRDVANRLGPNCTGFPADVSHVESADRVVREVIATFGQLEILVNNAAANPFIGSTIDVDPDAWSRTLDMNLTAPLLWSQAAWRVGLQQARQSCIVNIGSVGGLWTSPDHGVYDISKAALLHLTRQLAAELGPRTRVNAVVPGLTPTDLNRALFREPGSEERLAAKYPTGRLGRGEDTAAAVLFLASERASWITGQSLVVDGGGQIGFERFG